MGKIGIILNNIGTPRSPEPKDVGVYLDEFLMDPDVISLPYFLRALLVKTLIVPFRSKSSGAKYRAIWMKEGSPLLVYTESLRNKLQQELGPDYIVTIGMRYGAPSLSQALEELKQKGAERIIFAPLYPQYAEATTGSVTRYFNKLLEKFSFKASVLRPFYYQDFFLAPSVKILKETLEHKNFDHLLFSYHGLPESQIKQNPGCLNYNCCQRPEVRSEVCAFNCYKAQCHETSEHLAKRLGLTAEQWSTSFQSRLGPTKWIGPATTEEVQRLVGLGKKHIVVACPAFVTDCLETLEEIGKELRHDFTVFGGVSFDLVPCLNDNDLWVKSLAMELRKH